MQKQLEQSTQKSQVVIFIPGLGDQDKSLAEVVEPWRDYGFVPIVHAVGWGDPSKTFATKLVKLLALIDRKLAAGNIVSLVGLSAGGSAVINAFAQRKNQLHRVISLCGRLSVGDEAGLRSFAARTKSSPAFAESVQSCQKLIGELSKSDKQKIMTVRAKFGDELVPAETSVIDGAKNIELPTAEHVFTMRMALTFFAGELRGFLRGDELYYITF